MMQYSYSMRNKVQSRRWVVDGADKAPRSWVGWHHTYSYGWSSLPAQVDDIVRQYRATCGRLGSSGCWAPVRTQVITSALLLRFHSGWQEGNQRACHTSFGMRACVACSTYSGAGLMPANLHLLGILAGRNNGRVGTVGCVGTLRL